MWTSESRPTGRPSRRCAARALALAAVLGAGPTGAPAGAQGPVHGEVALVQRPNADAADLAGAVVWLVPRGRTAADSPTRADGSIVMRRRDFTPHVLPIRVGGTVGFPNDDPFSHNVFSNAEPGPFDLGLYRRGVTRSATFEHAGVYPIYCNIHSKMAAFVVAVPTPWVAQPDGAGRFVIDDVPAGSYVLHAWHERGTSELTQLLTVPAGGVSGIRVTLDGRAYVPAPHLNKFGRPYAVLRSDRY